MKVNKYLSDHFTGTYPIGTYAPFKDCGDTKKPDTIVIQDDMMLIVETDERGHEGYELSCEWAKALQHGQSSIQTPGIKRCCFIRFNPDVWKVSGVTTRYPLKERLEDLKALIQDAVANQTETYTLHHLFYPTDNENDKGKKVSAEELQEWFERLSDV